MDLVFSFSGKDGRSNRKSILTHDSPPVRGISFKDYYAEGNPLLKSNRLKCKVYKNDSDADFAYNVVAFSLVQAVISFIHV